MDLGLSPESITSDVGTMENKPKTIYRCKKCRSFVAAPENVVNHTPAKGESSFGWQKRKKGNPDNRSEEVECTSMFVEPLKWMTNGKTFVSFLYILPYVSTFGSLIGYKHPAILGMCLDVYA